MDQKLAVDHVFERQCFTCSHFDACPRFGCDSWGRTQKTDNHHSDDRCYGFQSAHFLKTDSSQPAPALCQNRNITSYSEYHLLWSATRSRVSGGYRGKNTALHDVEIGMNAEDSAAFLLWA